MIGVFSVGFVFGISFVVILLKVGMILLINICIFIRMMVILVVNVKDWMMEYMMKFWFLVFVINFFVFGVFFIIRIIVLIMNRIFIVRVVIMLELCRNFNFFGKLICFVLFFLFLNIFFSKVDRIVILDEVCFNVMLLFLVILCKNGCVIVGCNV